MKKYLFAGMFSLFLGFFQVASAESIVATPLLPPDFAKWQKMEFDCSPIPGKNITTSAHVLGLPNGSQLIIGNIALNGEKLIQSDLIIIPSQQEVGAIRTYVKNKATNNWTKYEFALGDSFAVVDAKILEAVGLTKEQLLKCVQ